MLHDILLALWFMLPAGMANLIPMVVAKVPALKRFDAPLDGGRMYRGKELLGKHKTWRGLISGMIISTIVLWLQQIAVANTGWGEYIANGVDYAAFPTLILGPLFGLGALGGDALKSFFKRQKGVKSGDSWIPFDQLDYIIGAILVTLPFVVLDLTVYAWIFVYYFGLHLLFSYLGWKTGFKDKPI